MDWIVVKDCEDDDLKNLKLEEEEDEKRKRYAAGGDEDLELDVELEEEKEIPDHEKQERYIEDYFEELKKPRFYLFSASYMPWKMYRPVYPNIRESEHIVLVDSPVNPDSPIKPFESFENHKPKPRPPPTHRILYPPPPDTEIKYPFAFYCEKAITEFNKKKGTQYTFGGLVEARMLYELDIKFTASLAYGKAPETFEVSLKIPGNDCKSNILIYDISLLASPTAPASTLVLYDPRSHYYRRWL